MSRLVNAIRARSTGKPKAPLSALTVKDTWMNRQSITAQEYLIGVSLHHSVVITDEMIQQSESDALLQAMETAQQAVIEEVFGEFRPHFREIHLALWKQDFDGAIAALRAMEAQMFSAEE